LKKKIQEEENKKNQVKNQKDILSNLYQMKQRPNLRNCQESVPYFVMPHEFIREWRHIIKTNKFKDLQINNSILFCQHNCLPFDQTNFDDTL
jgi:hypothetical protein